MRMAPARLTCGLGLAAATLLAVAACGGASPSRPAGSSPAAGSPPAVGGPPTASAAPGEFNGTDGAWLQLMAAMNERVLPVLDLAEQRATDPAARRLARDARTDHLAELARLRDLLDTAGLPADNPHRGHDMPGMPTAAQLDALRSATGPAFDRLFAQALRGHLDQGLNLADGERRSGASARVKELAGAVEQARSAHRTRLDRLDRPAPATAGATAR